MATGAKLAKVAKVANGQRAQQQEWRVALESTREAWRSSYLGIPGPGSSLSLSLLDALSGSRNTG